MCHYITAVIDIQTNLERLNELGKEHIISFHQCGNTYVEAQLANNELYLAKHCKFCDCGTHLGMFARKQSPAVRIEKQEIEKLERKGWSETKIKRWIADREKSMEKNKTKYENLRNGPHIDVANWLAYFQKILSQEYLSRIGLLLHWYRGSVERERINISDRKKIKVNELTEEMLLNMEEDIVYDILRT